MKNFIFLLFILSTGYAFGQDVENVIKNKPIKISGGISAGSFFNASSAINRVPKMGYSFSARSNLSLYGISIPFSINFNEQGKTFSQPFNRYGLSPKYKWVKLHLGWRSMDMSQFTLSNETFLGAGIELTPWKLRLSAMYGQFKKASKIDDVNFIAPQFRRKGFAFKAGVGTENNHFDLVFFKAKDDTLSVMATDSILRNISAHENAVVGFKTKIGLYKRVVVFHADAALSAFTLNTRYRFIPSDIHPIVEKASKIFAPNISSQFNYAGEAGLTLKFKSFSLATIYRRVMPEFKSLGANYIIDDIEALTINPRFSLMKNKILVSGSYGIQRNNLNGFRQSNGTKNIGSLNVQVNPSIDFGVSLSYSNYSFKQQVIRDNFVGDSILIDQVNHNINVSPRYTIIKTNSVQNFILVLNYQVLDDKNAFTEQFSDNKVLLANLNYSYNSKKAKWSFRAGLNYFEFSSSIIGISRYGGNLGVSKRFLKDKVNFGFNASFSIQEQLITEKNILVLNSNLTYQITKKLGLTARVYMNSNILENTTVTETRSQLGLSLKF